MKNRSLEAFPSPGLRAAIPSACVVRRHVARWFFSWIACAIAVQAAAAPEDETTRTIVRQEMPVKIANRTIILLRGPIFGYTAMERAARTSDRLDQVLDSEMFLSVTIE